jgi:alkylhydroperoxidase/carboxymuconolactone decarboxylase family protein YurZ
MNPDSEAVDHGRDVPPLAPPAGARGQPEGTSTDAMSPRDTSLLDIAVAAAHDRADALREQVGLALANGITPQEIVDILDLVALHAGRPHEHQLTILGDALDDME